MEYKETINKGLKRSYEVTVPSSEVEAQVNNKILEPTLLASTTSTDSFPLLTEKISLKVGR